MIPKYCKKYTFMFDSQSIIVITAPKAKAINKMTCYFYPCGLLLGNNIIIDRIIVLFDFIQSSHSCS